MKTIGVTMGDPAGIGPEICLKLLAAPSGSGEIDLKIIGSHEVLKRVAAASDLPVPQTASVLDLANIDAESIAPGKVDAHCGRAAVEYVYHAIDLAQGGEIDAFATAPINKESVRTAGIDFPGHTEMIADRTDATRYCMLQVSDEVTASFVTCHCGYGEVPGLISRDRILDVIELTHEALKRMRGCEPKLTVLGLNPHAGEHGLFGDSEEEKSIVPAVEDARAAGMDIVGPISPDTAFIPAMRQQTDGFVCMYHDQGHIPLKALAFDRAVNVTLGIPIVRTSVDHGTAFDIAWQGKANEGSLIEAVKLAAQLAS